MSFEKSSLSDAVSGALDQIGRVLAFAGTFVLVGSLALLVFQYFGSAGASEQAIREAASISEWLAHGAFWAALCAALGWCWLAWGEEILAPLLLLAWALLFFSPTYLSSTGPQSGFSIADRAVDGMVRASTPLGVVGLIVLVVDVVGRIKLRLREGSRADQLQYGKGLREERDIQNTFLGKCWQLPYCRKFVREKCPIYHARRTCWKERVGCMCEESVIRNAMEGRVIPTDLVAAAKFIPYNQRLTKDQKAERCRQCVIYNEHQKHKYQLALPVTVLTIVGVYVIFRENLGDGIEVMLGGIQRTILRATLSQESGPDSVGLGATGFFNEIILFGLVVLCVSYSIRLIEYLFFKLKV